MKKIPIIALFLLIQFGTRGQTDTIKIDEITVSSNRNQLKYSESMRAMSLIGSQDIRENASNDIIELLDAAPNIDIRQRGNFGVQADVSVRGGTFDQALILLNGVKISDPQTGHHNLDIPVDLSAIDRIEILQGAGSRVFGPNAFTGAINIITKNPTENNSLDVDAFGGQYKTYGAAITGNFSTSVCDNMFSISKKSSDGYTDNTDFDIKNLFCQSRIKTGLSDFSVIFGATNKEFGANSFYTPAYPNQFEHTQTYFSHIKTEMGQQIKITPGIFWRRHNDCFKLFRNNAPSWYTSPNYHQTDKYGVELNANMKSKIGKFSFGGEYNTETIWSNVLGELTDNTRSVRNVESTNYDHYAERQNLNLFAEYLGLWKKFSFSSGVLAFWNSDYSWNYYPGIDLGWRFDENLRLFASVNRSMRLPTFTDLYYDGTTNVGNPDLKPEEAWSYETGVKFLNDFLSVQVAAFYRDGKNIIDWVKDPENPVIEDNDTIWACKNLLSLKTVGIEFSSTLYPGKLLWPDFFIRKLSISYSFIDAQKETGDIISKYALDYLKHKLIISSKFAITSKTGIDLNINLQDRAGTYTYYDSETGLWPEEREYNPLLLADIRLWWNKNWNINNLKTMFYVDVTNMLNCDYYDIANVPMPGISIMGGIKCNLNFRNKKK